MSAPPHGGRLIDRVLTGAELERARDEALSLPRIEVSDDTVADLVNIATGVYSPLEGFMGRGDFESVLEYGRLTSGLPWTVPVTLDVPAEVAGGLGERVALALDGAVIALLEVSDVFPQDRRRRALQVFGTDDERHPGVARTLSQHELLVSGRISLLDSPVDVLERAWRGREGAGRLLSHYLTPAETRVFFERRGWRTVVGFQTRNIPHLGHEYVQKSALTFVDGLFINPVIGRKKPGDFKDVVIVESYRALLEHYYPRRHATMAILPMEMKYAGPREAIHHAVMRKNYGCTHFIVGRDHAGVGNYYGPYDAQHIFYDYPDLGITPMFFTAFFYCRKCVSVANDKTCPHADDLRVNFSGTTVRRLVSGGEIPEGFVRPEVAEVVRSFPNPFVE